MSERRSRLRRTRLRILRAVFLIVSLSDCVAGTLEAYSVSVKQLDLLKNLETNDIEYPHQQPNSRVVDANIQCKKLCNYQPVESEDVQCFGSFKSDCTVSQLFADGHVLESKISVNCIGGFKNTTAYSGNVALVDTECKGQFQQVQDMNVYERLIEESAAMEGFTTFVKTDTYHTSYSCRHLFVVAKKLDLDAQMEPSALSGSVMMTCDGAQDIRVETGYCSCSKECSQSLNVQKVFTFSVAAGEMIVRANATVNQHREANGDRMVEDNFRRVAVHDPKLARRVAHAIVDPIQLHRLSGVEESDVHPLIREYHTTENVYAFKSGVENSKWGSLPSTSWLHVLCNGVSTPYECTCNGVLSANVRFGQRGSAFLMCQGGWNAYEDVTYVCNGIFSEDESDSNDFGTYFTKISRCDGTLAVSPLSSIPADGMKYYGLSEICVGASTVQSSYTLEELDLRYLAHVVDPRTVEQVVCLMADKNCKQLRYFT